MLNDHLGSCQETEGQVVLGRAQEAMRWNDGAIRRDAPSGNKETHVTQSQSIAIQDWASDYGQNPRINAVLTCGSAIAQSREFMFSIARWDSLIHSAAVVFCCPIPRIIGHLEL
jgi:hypothetical protein